MGRNADLPECGSGTVPVKDIQIDYRCRNADLPECGIGTYPLRRPEIPRLGVGTPICPSVGLELLALRLLVRLAWCRNADLPECGIGTATQQPHSMRSGASERRFARVWDWNIACLTGTRTLMHVGTPICPSVGLELERSAFLWWRGATSERRFARVWDWNKGIAGTRHWASRR